MWHSTFPGQAIFVDKNIAKLGHTVSTKQLISATSINIFRQHCFQVRTGLNDICDKIPL